jgi:hypothetical protein
MKHYSFSKSSSTGRDGKPGIGFKLTETGDFDIQKRRLTNVAQPQSNDDALTMDGLLSSPIGRGLMDFRIDSERTLRSISDSHNKVTSDLQESIARHENDLDDLSKLSEDRDIRNSKLIKDMRALIADLVNKQKEMDSKIISQQNDIDDLFTKLNII